MDNEVEACSERVCDHVHRSLAGIGNLLIENSRNTLCASVTMDRSTGSLYLLLAFVGCISSAASRRRRTEQPGLRGAWLRPW